MTKKESMSFNVPTPVRQAFEEVAKRYSVKEKWAVCTAAILLLVEAGEAEQHELFKLAKGNDFDDASMRALVERALTGSLRPEPKPISSSVPMKKAGKPHRG